ncbi:MAG TPA: undecaprenyldiphospho-muramoylpentapeptide beta-N-acetylglucosaminyltransferase [Stellaceae bacterium]|jgi:UDP-N-acetylglucosamine--N-acetylmuramyl-(pentapeptide) pyrophosphoryl-undecaprenol N-acetylglucosamine transferase|nr:undecaprenyldiphospho-muramoylpentapeptide beta-N-acetylglucosaminyltransferase [Stellaceae bacterium]
MGTLAKRAPIVLAAGGTGGHMFPAEALAAELVARGRAVALVTDRRGQSFGDRVPGVATHRIRAGRFDAGLLGKVVGIAELILGIAQAAIKLRALAPAAVIGFGGYPSVPTVLAAARLGIPSLIHEQNALLGRANRFLAPRVRRIALSFAATAGLAPAERARASETGNPVRPAIAAQRERAYAAPTADGAIELVVTGGSQGARIFSEITPAALSRLPAPLRARLRLSQQVRPEDLAAVRAAYAASGVAAELASFFEDVPARLARAQLVIARAGASTVAELTTVGRPALLIPYPHAADDHQSANARAFAASGAGWTMAQPDFTADNLARFLTETLAAPERLAGAAAAAKALGRPLAARSLADLVLATIGANGDHPTVTEDAA